VRIDSKNAFRAAESRAGGRKRRKEDESNRQDAKKERKEGRKRKDEGSCPQMTQIHTDDEARKKTKEESKAIEQVERK